MSRFAIAAAPLDTARLRAALADPGCGAFVAFEGWVRNSNEGRAVRRLEYEAYAPLALVEGERVIGEALARFDIRQAACVHRVGALELGELAVWVGVSAPHRDAAFRACRYVIDEIKHRLPVWKKELYADGTAEWVNCAACEAAPRSAESSG